MSTIDLSSYGKDLKKTYDAIVSKDPSISWAVFNYEASTTNALKPYSQGSSGLEDFVEEFDDGKVQFGFARVTDPNSQLTKFVLVGWCGEGVPVRTKGYFNSNFAAIAKYFYGYHVQITARDADDLDPSDILQKVASASGANYSGKSIPRSAPVPRAKPVVAVSTASAPTKPKPTANTASYESRPNIPAVIKPRVSTRPQFTQTTAAAGANEDDWGTNAPAIEETDGHLTKVKSAYQPTKVDLAAIKSQKSIPSAPQTSFGTSESTPSSASDNEPVKGTYQPIGKVDLSAIRAQAKAAGLKEYNDRPEPIRGSYEPVGKVDIAAIKAKGSRFEPSTESKPISTSSNDTNESERVRSVSERMSTFSDSGRLTSLPKHKVEKTVSSRYQASESSPSFGTRPPVSGSDEYGLRTNISSGGSRDFALQNGKTPAQIWAEKHGKVNTVPSTYKSTADSLEEKFGQTSINDDSKREDEQEQEQEEEQTQTQEHYRPSGLRSNLVSTGSVPIISSGVPVLPSRGVPQKEEEGEEAYEGEQEQEQEEEEAQERIEEHSDFEQDEPEAFTPPPNLSTRPLPPVLPTRAAEPEPEPEFEPEVEVEAEPEVEAEAGIKTQHDAQSSNTAKALVQYDYEPQEDNEIALFEGEVITEIEFVDEDWWLGKNSKGDHGLFPANYVELIEDDSEHVHQQKSEIIIEPEEPTAEFVSGPSARAEYDYEAVEDNELTFAENDIISDIDFVDEDWWSGVFKGERKLFPANYVSLLE